jgi:hypothetical protein
VENCKKNSSLTVALYKKQVEDQKASTLPYHVIKSSILRFYRWRVLEKEAYKQIPTSLPSEARAVGTK